VAYYSIIHLTADELATAFAELRRVLRPDAPALLAFHTGRHVVRLDDWWGVPVALDFISTRVRRFTSCSRKLV
jgi:hypothetical protein